MSSNGTVLKSGIWYTISNFLVRGIGLITTPIFTRLLTQEEFGAFSNYTSWLTMLTIVVTLNVEATLISARYEHEENLSEYILSVLSLSLISGLIWWGTASLFIDKASDILNMEPIYVHSLFAYILVSPAISLFQSREQLFYRYKMSVFMSMLLSIGASLLAVVLVTTMSNHLTGRILGMFLPTFCIGLVLIIYFFIAGKKIQTKYWKEALKIVLPFIPHLLSLTMLNLMDRVMITRMCGERENALYSLAYNVAAIITMLLSSLNGAFAPWLGEQLANEKYESIRKVSKGYILLFVYLAIGVMLLAPEVLWILGGESYLEAKWIMVPVALGCVCQFIYTLFVNVEQFKKRTVGMAFASVSAALINLVLNMWLIPLFGYVAAAYTTLIGYVWLLLVHMYLVYRMKLGKIYSYKFIFCVLLAMVGVAALTYALYSADIVRYIVVLIYVLAIVLIMYKKRDLIKDMLKKKK